MSNPSGPVDATPVRRTGPAAVPVPEPVDAVPLFADAAPSLRHIARLAAEVVGAPAVPVVDACFLALGSVEALVIAVGALCRGSRSRACPGAGVARPVGVVTGPYVACRLAVVGLAQLVLTLIGRGTFSRRPALIRRCSVDTRP